MIAAIAVVRDEADIIETTVRQMQAQVDAVFVMDNGSTDGTTDILHDLGVTVIVDNERAFYQAAKVTKLAGWARNAGAEWVVPFDADEWWTAPPGQSISSVLRAQANTVDAVGAVFWNHVPTTADDTGVSNPVDRMRHRELGNGSMLRVACRTSPNLTIEDGNHFVFYGNEMAFAWPQLVVRHYSLRSFDQFCAKARKCVEGLRDARLHPAIAAHWREWEPIIDDPDALGAVWESKVRDPNDFTLIEDPARRPGDAHS